MTVADSRTKHTKETRATGTIDERDDLTGVRGYYTLVRDFDYEAHSASQSYVALCDVDDFRYHNEAYGENRCNGVLARIGHAMQDTFGDEHVFRYASDEFLIVGEFVDEDTIRRQIKQLDKLIADIDVNGTPLNISCSYGCVYGVVCDSDGLHEAIRLADRKMYEAKRLGKGRVVTARFTEDPHAVGEKRHESLQRAYETDEITKLMNPVYFRRHFEEELAEQKKNPSVSPDERLTLIYFNIQNFKAYNQRYGFDEGDNLLRLVADAIRDAFSGCLAARIPVDEFMVVAPRANAEKGFYEVRHVFREFHKDTSIWLRVGYYTPSDDDDDIILNMDRAKMACDSIRGRRDTFHAEYDDELKSQILMHRHVLDDFETALEEGWVRPFYQPIVRVATGEVCDLEALARWVDPERGIVSPADFIPVLESARVIDKLDLHIVRCVCQDYAKSRAEGRHFVPLSVNLSRLDFELCHIVDEITAIVDEYEVPHEHFSIEVTESTLAGNVEFLKGEVDRFRELGFQVWMDDFGSGYSSLNVLKEYKFDLVKVDMGFLRDFENNESARIILSHVIGMAKELDIKTLVEGVETEEQYEFLRSIGCGRGQGWHFGRPQEIGAIREAVDNGTFPEIEGRSLYDFYEDIGRINMMRPNPAPSIDGHYVPGDIPAVIVERVKGKWRFLNVSDTYMAFLRAMGVESVEATESGMNSDDASYVRLRESIEDAARTNKWIRSDYRDLGIGCSLVTKLIARDDAEDAICVIVVTEEGYGASL